MKKELFAALLLTALIGAAAFNLKCINMLTVQVVSELELSEQQLEAGDYGSAVGHLDAAYRLWENSYGYSHILIRHSEIDTSADCFFDLREMLLKKDSAGAKAAFMKLRYHLECIAHMERPTPGSIL